MKGDEVIELYEYNRWATARMLDAAASLENESFTKDMGSSFALVRDTLVHIMSAEWVWLQRWKGNSPRAMPEDVVKHSSYHRGQVTTLIRQLGGTAESTDLVAFYRDQSVHA
jgi:uncharacterized damage-inducible protein DinB